MRFVFAVASALVATMVWAGPRATYVLDAKESTLKFQGASFLHSVKGEAKSFTGSGEAGETLENLNGALSIEAEKIDTGIEKRNEHMYKILETTKYPKIEFRLTGAKVLPNRTEDGRVIHDLKDGEYLCHLKGDLKIKGKSAPIEGKGLCKRVSTELWIIEGEAPVDTTVYGVEGPNIIFARMDPVVRVMYKLNFRKK